MLTKLSDLNKHPYYLKPGDIILVQSKGWLSNMIRYFSTSNQETYSWASHVAMVFTVYDKETFIIEALNSVEIHPITYYEHKPSQLIIFRKPNGLTHQEQAILKETALRHFTKEYGWLALGAHALDRLFNNNYVFRRMLNFENYPICSWLVAHGYATATKLRMAEPPESAQPDDIMDFCMANHWEIVFASDEINLNEVMSTLHNAAAKGHFQAP